MNARNSALASALQSDGRDTTVRELLKPIQNYLDQPGVNEIAINTPGELWVKTFSGWTLQSVPSLSYDTLDRLSLAICVYNSVGYETVNSLQLPGGERVQINRPPATQDGTIAINIRTHSTTVKSLEELAIEGAFEDASDVSFNRPTEDEISRLLAAKDFTRLDPIEAELLRLKAAGDWPAFLQLAVIAKRNMVIAGATGSGKTTFARSLIEKVPAHERIVTFEDVHELKLPSHPNRVHMMFGEGQGRISAKECLRAAMRMSPDRIFPAEIRGDEAWDYLNSLNTGHPGSIVTVHASSAIETYGRVFDLAIPGASGLDAEFVKDKIYSTIHITLYFHNRKLIEVFYDPIFSKSKMA